MNEQIVIKYKEETLIKSEMTEREKAIWDDGYKQGVVEGKEPFSIAKFFAGFILGLFMFYIILHV